jgi:hypothetical protein
VEIQFTLSSAMNKVEIRLHTSGVTALAVKRSIGIRML